MEAEAILLVCLFISFFVTYLMTPLWINAAIRVKLTGKDMNKFKWQEVPEMGGVAVIAGFLAGVLSYIGISTFILHQDSFLILILATISTVLIITIVGMLDDVLGWKMGLKQWHKPLMTLTAALPMMVVNAGQSRMYVPILGTMDFGVLYPLLIVPIIIVVGANGFNMLAGYNGLEAGMGVIILSAMGLIALKVGGGWITMLSFSMVLALLAFLRYNWYPAKVFPGDSLTYSVGALIGSIAILGNMEKIAGVLFLPYFLDFLLPLRKRMNVEAWAKVNKDDSLDMPYGEIYDVTHLAIFIIKKIKNKVYERDVVIFILIIELFLVFIVSLIWVL